MGVEGVIQTLQAAISTAQHTADTAMNSISTHEKVCAERYGNIKKKQDDLNDILIPKIFTALATQNKILYTGMGLFIGIPFVMGFCYAIYEVIKSVAK